MYDINIINIILFAFRLYILYSRRMFSKHTQKTENAVHHTQASATTRRVQNNMLVTYNNFFKTRTIFVDTSYKLSVTAIALLYVNPGQYIRRETIYGPITHNPKGCKNANTTLPSCEMHNIIIYPKLPRTARGLTKNTINIYFPKKQRETSYINTTSSSTWFVG